MPGSGKPNYVGREDRRREVAAQHRRCRVELARKCRVAEGLEGTLRQEEAEYEALKLKYAALSWLASAFQAEGVPSAELYLEAGRELAQHYPADLRLWSDETSIMLQSLQRSLTQQKQLANESVSEFHEVAAALETKGRRLHDLTTSAYAARKHADEARQEAQALEREFQLLLYPVSWSRG
mmetsp:Transcript_14055/g.30428  ORF Transcript_14055/g.30428 Transcript_14055/m.30428 type:complete len:181 (-) Transcript_14055:245-787(-)